MIGRTLKDLGISRHEIHLYVDGRPPRED